MPASTESVTDARRRYEIAAGLIGPTLVHAAIGLALEANLSVVADDPEMSRRLDVLLDAFRRVAAVEDNDIARAVFLGAVDRLDGRNIIMALRAGRLDEVKAYVKSIEDNGGTPGGY
jgi:hypothetical protein